jgi:hypothetical protein
MVNQQFRRDIFVRGARLLAPGERQEILSSMRFALIKPRDQVPLKFQSNLGEATMNADSYNPLLDAMAAGGYAPKSMSELMKLPALDRMGFNELLTSMIVLVGAGHAHPCQSSKDEEAVAETAKALNAHLANAARFSGDIGFLSSPVLGGGVALNRIQQLFLVALRGGRNTQQTVVKFVWDELAAQNQRLIKGGKALETEQENLAELGEQWNEFITKLAPVLAALRVTL